MKEIYEMKGAGRSIRDIARELDISRNTVRRYLKSPEAMRPKPRPLRGSKLDPYTEYIDYRIAEGLEKLRGAAPGDQGSGLPGLLLDGGAVREAEAPMAAAGGDDAV